MRPFFRKKVLAFSFFGRIIAPLNKQETKMKKTYTIMAFSTFTGKTVYRVLTNGCLESTRGAAKRKFTSRKNAEKFAKFCAEQQL